MEQLDNGQEDDNFDPNSDDDDDDEEEGHLVKSDKVDQAAKNVPALKKKPNQSTES